MHIDPNIALEAAAAFVTASGGIYATLRHVISASKKRREAHKQSILDQAKEELLKVEASLEEKIKNLRIELEAQKENVNKDLSHLREVYNTEIKVLGEKIENLRTDLQEQHRSMIELLTKLVNNR